MKRQNKEGGLKWARLLNTEISKDKNHFPAAHLLDTNKGAIFAAGFSQQTAFRKTAGRIAAEPGDEACILFSKRARTVSGQRGHQGYRRDVQPGLSGRRFEITDRGLEEQTVQRNLAGTI